MPTNRPISREKKAPSEVQIFPLCTPKLQQYSNSYSNADDIEHYFAVHSEQQNQEMSAWRTTANANEQVQAHPVIDTI
jgi:hypothetical protein